MEIDPARLSQVERYKLEIGAIVPRPIAWVSTVSGEGALNLAPFSFFAGVAAEPFSLLFCPSNKSDGSEKDTLRNVEATGEFVVNIVSEKHAIAMAASAEDLPFGESEFAMAGLEAAPSTKVKPPRVAGAPVSFECEPLEVIRLAPGKPSGGNVVIGRVLWAHVDDAIIDERMRIDPGKLAAIGRMAGLGYCTTRDRFELPWGQDALGSAPPPNIRR